MVDGEQRLTVMVGWQLTVGTMVESSRIKSIIELVVDKGTLMVTNTKNIQEWLIRRFFMVKDLMIDYTDDAFYILIWAGSSLMHCRRFIVNDVERVVNSMDESFDTSAEWG